MAVAFTDRELDIMAVLWEHGPSTVAEVRERLADPLSHNTVATMLTILEKKGHVGHTEEGRAFRYRALVARDEAGRSAFTRMIDTIFGGSAEALLTHFVRDRKLTPDEIARVRALLDEQLERREPPKTRRRKP
ncbi:MAG TPA: BlaI/MecI/CopY family transcriptional regulator [Gemmatimonadaceae bacterium]|nr:BlaI/MecI/CopY family transcriptional regulator [Gemmatimonadaceae bacterium]